MKGGGDTKNVDKKKKQVGCKDKGGQVRGTVPTEGRLKGKKQSKRQCADTRITRAWARTPDREKKRGRDRKGNIKK